MVCTVGAVVGKSVDTWSWLESVCRLADIGTEVECQRELKWRGCGWIEIGPTVWILEGPGTKRPQRIGQNGRGKKRHGWSVGTGCRNGNGAVDFSKRKAHAGGSTRPSKKEESTAGAGLWEEVVVVAEG